MLEYYLRVILGLVYMEVGDPRCVRGPQVCQGTRLGGVTRLSILSLIEFDGVYMTGG